MKFGWKDKRGFHLSEIFCVKNYTSTKYHRVNYESRAEG